MGLKYFPGAKAGKSPKHTNINIKPNSGNKLGGDFGEIVSLQALTPILSYLAKYLIYLSYLAFYTFFFLGAMSLCTCWKVFFTGLRQCKKTDSLLYFPKIKICTSLHDRKHTITSAAIALSKQMFVFAELKLALMQQVSIYLSKM